MELQRVRPAAGGAEGDGPGRGGRPVRWQWEAQRDGGEPCRVAVGSTGWQLALPRHRKPYVLTLVSTFTLPGVEPHFVLFPSGCFLSLVFVNFFFAGLWPRIWPGL